MRRRVPVDLVPTVIRLSEPKVRDGKALEDRIRACQEAEVRLMTGPGREHEAVYRLLDALSELRLSGYSPEDFGPQTGDQGHSRGNLPLF